MRLLRSARNDSPYSSKRLQLLSSTFNDTLYSRKIITLLFSFLVIVLAGCGGKSIDEDTLAKTYADLIIAADTVSAATPIKEVKAKVFKKNGVTESDYNKSLSLYNEDPERWAAFFDKAIAYLESQRIEKKDSL